MSLFHDVKAAVTTRQAAEHYGFHVSRNGMMCCPFHQDKSPSMKADKNFICFGCQEKGDVIRFTARLFGLTPKDAALKLATDFGLNITGQDLGKAPQMKPRQPDPGWARLKLLEQSADRMYGVYCDYLHLLQDWKIRYAPKSPDEDWHPLFVEACQQTAYVEYLLDCLFEGTPEDKAMIVMEKKKEVETLERRIADFKSREAGRAGQGIGPASGTYPYRGTAGDDGSHGQRHRRRDQEELCHGLSA